MVWDGVGYLANIEGGVDGELAKILKFYHPKPEELIFQQDNAPCHKAKFVTDWLMEQQYDIMEWPSSPLI